MGQPRKIIIGKCLAVLSGAVPLLLYANASGPLARRSGVPADPQPNLCTECHVGTANSGGGKVEVSFPGGLTYTPGVKQQITVTVSDPQAGRTYGFQLTARLASDELNGQAGTLTAAAGESQIAVFCGDDRLRPAGGCPASATIESISHTQPRRSGTWNLEWTPPDTDRGPVKIYVAGNSANGDNENTGDRIYTASYELTPNAGQPTGPRIAAQRGVVNSASFAETVSPGSFVSIFGENLGPAVGRDWSGAINGLQLPTEIDGVSVTVGGKPAAIAFLRSDIINVLLPPDDMSGSIEVKVTTPQGSSTATANVQRYAPGFLIFPWENKYIISTHGDFVFVAKPGLIPGLTTRPAAPGETITVWGTGFGPTNPAVPPLQVLEAAHPVADLSQVRVTMAGRDCAVSFAGVFPAGVYLVNFTVPSDLQDGDHEVIAEVAGARTQSGVFITVQRNQ